MPLNRLAVALATTIVCAACATTGTPSSFTNAPVHRASVSQRGMLTSADFARVSDSDLYGAIIALQPALFTPRGGTVTIAIDGVLAGDPSVLRSIPAQAVASVRLIHGPDATMRWGSRHAGAVLSVTMRTR